MLSDSFIFYDVNNDFTEILNDVAISDLIGEKVEWPNHLMIVVSTSTSMTIDEIGTYLNLKYSNKLFRIKDFTPINGIDYLNRCPYGTFTSHL